MAKHLKHSVESTFSVEFQERGVFCICSKRNHILNSSHFELLVPCNSIFLVIQCTFFLLCCFSLFRCHTEQLYPCPHVLLLRIVGCSSDASLSVVEEVHHSGAAGEWWALVALQQVLVFSVGSFGLYQQKILVWIEGEVQSKSFYIFMHTDHFRNPASVSLLLSGQKGGRNWWRA